MPSGDTEYTHAYIHTYMVGMLRLLYKLLLNSMHFYVVSNPQEGSVKFIKIFCGCLFSTQILYKVYTKNYCIKFFFFFGLHTALVK